MATFTWIPDKPLNRTRKAKVNASNFGDGYVQRSKDGINTIGDVWMPSFTVRTRAEINAIDAFLELMAGVSSFTWTTPAGITSKFTCDEWSPVYKHDQDAELSAKFVLRYEP